MVSNFEEESRLLLRAESKVMEDEVEELSPNSTVQSGRPTSMVIKKANRVIPAHLVAEAISRLHGLDMRWSGPITPSEMQYVEEYVVAKYPQYCNGLVNEEDEDQNSPKYLPTTRDSSSSHSFTITLSDLDMTRLEPSRLLDILTKKSSFQGNFISIPEIQGRNRALKHCGLTETDYTVIFTSNYKEAMSLIAESYPFFRGNFYMTIIDQQLDPIREIAVQKECRITPAPLTWLDLRIKGSQLSQYFRRKSKYIPKGLFCYPAVVNGTRYSMHWISEGRRNSWHVVLDATEMVVGEERLNLALHRPDFVLCTLDNIPGQLPLKITCLLVRRRSFDC